MARAAPRVQDGLLTPADGDPARPIAVGAPAWFAWLAGAASFRFECPQGDFTARKERAGHGRGGAYWKAYRRRDGRLRRAYLGRDADLTLARLIGAATALATPPPPRPAAAAPAPAGGLPGALTRLIGRERELAEIRTLLGDAPLLTLTGVGGVGKTRLALEVARAAVADYPDGVWLVELAALADPALVPHTVAVALGVMEQPGRPPTETLAAWLAGKRLLLALDNCEHLIDACAALADALLRAVPGMRILATSREPLAVAGEVTWPAPPLTLPDLQALPPLDDLARSEAVRLFVDRATAARPDFRLTAANAPAVAQLCVRLDGLPLAIELAAARVRSLPPAELAARLDRRFQLLTGGSRAALPRHQTLRAALDWSYDLLTEDERRVLRRLSVFAGGATIAAAEAVCAGDGLAPADVLPPLLRLVERSLVLAEPTGDEARYRLLETVRAYALERLVEAGEERAARDRHAAWCAALAERAEPELQAADQLTWLARLDAERDNLRAALAWSLEEEPPAGLRLAGGIWPYWRVRAHFTEGERWLDSLLARAPEPTAPRATALLGAASLARTQGRKATARARLEEALPLCRALGDRRLLAWTLRELGFLLPELGAGARGRALLEEGLAIVRADGDEHGLGATLFMLAVVVAAEGDYARAWALGEESLAVLRRVGDRWLIGDALSRLGSVALWEGDCARARALWEEALPLAHELGAPNMMAMLHIRLGWAALWQGDTERAEAQYEACRSLARRHGVDTSLAQALTGLGRVAQVRGEGARATVLLTESLALYTARGATQGAGEAQYGLGLAARDLGDLARAADWLRRSLAVRRAEDDRPGIATCLEGLATVAAGQGRPARAARLLGAAEALRRAIGSPMPLVERPASEAAARTARTALGEAAFAAAWAAGAALPPEQAVVEALADEPAPTATITSTVATPLAPAGLTAREVEVLRLLARGATDPAIARELSISVKTVNKHVASILGKTASPNRAAAAVVAARSGLA